MNVCEKSTSIPNFFFDISQRYNFFCVLEPGLEKLIKTVKEVLSTCRKFRCLSGCKKSTSHRSLLSWDIAKILHRGYFVYFRHAWLHPSDITLPTFWILWSFSLQKSTLSSTSFSRYYKDFANLLLRVLWARLAILTNINSVN